MQKRARLLLIILSSCLNVLHRHFFSLHYGSNLPSVSDLHKVQIYLPQTSCLACHSPLCICAADCSQEWHFDLILIELHLIFFRPFLRFIKVCFSPLCKALHGATATSGIVSEWASVCPRANMEHEHFHLHQSEILINVPFHNSVGGRLKGGNRAETLKPDAYRADLQALCSSVSTLNEKTTEMEAKWHVKENLPPLRISSTCWSQMLFCK